MGNIVLSNLSTICQMTDKLLDNLSNEKKKKRYCSFSNLLLELLEVETLENAVKKCNDIQKHNPLKWNVEKLSRENIFETLSFFPLVVDIGNPVFFDAIVKNLEDILKDRNPKTDTISIKKTICLMFLLNAIDVTCTDPKNLLATYNDEFSIIQQHNLFSSTSEQDVFIKLLLCVEMFCNKILTVKLIFKTINNDLYNSAVIFNINNKNDIINKRSKENEEKTSNFYSKILEIVGLLIAVFSIIGVNCFTLSCQTNVDIFNILLINASLVISIVLVLFLSHNIIHNLGTKKYYVIFFFAFLFFVGTLIAFFIKNNIIS